MEIERNIDIEAEMQTVLSTHMNAYCRPLPAQPELPCILVTQVGGTDLNHIDTFEVVLDSRAQTEEEASEYLRTAVGILRAEADAQTSALRFITVNTSGSWGSDPVRPDLAMCSARLRVVAHPETLEV